MNKEQFEKMLATNQASLDQMWTGMEDNVATLKQIIGIASPGLVTQFLQLVMFQTDHNINKRKLENMQ